MNILQLKHRLRYLRQLVKSPELAVIGGYHYGNLGDMTLGHAVCTQVTPHVRSDLQTIYNLGSWPNAPVAVLGGGAIIDEVTLEAVFRRYSPQHVAFCGVDIEDWNGVSIFHRKLQDLASFSLRSSAQLRELSSLFPCIKASYHPDNVFALAQSDTSLNRLRNVNEGIGLINITPRFHIVDRDSLCHDSELPEPTPFGLLADRYTTAMRCLCDLLLQRGLKLKHIPFTPADNNVATDVLSGQSVYMYRYSSDPLIVLSRYQTASYSFGSRYHSMIFSMISGVPFSAFAYASKSARLLADLPSLPQPFLSITDLLDPAVLDRKIKLIAATSIAYDPNLLDSLASRARAGIHAALKSLGVPVLSIQTSRG